MSVILFANNAATTLAGSVSSGATSCTVVTGTGALFPNPSAGQYFLLTFSDAATNTTREIVKVTARSGDVMTIVRAQEGTTAHAWSVADNAQNLWTAGSAATYAQAAQVQLQPDNYAVDGGSANAMTATLSLAPASYAAIVGAPIRIKKSANVNTGAVTLNLNGLGAVAVVTPAGAALTYGQLAASGIMTLVYDGASFEVQSSLTPSRSGELFHWPAPTPPAYALVRDGSAVSRTTYSALNALASAAGYADPWGPGNGTTTFNLPLDDGDFERNWISGGAVDPGRAFGSLQADAFAAHTHNVNTTSTANDAGTGNVRVSSAVQSPSTHTTTSAGTATETRPINRAYLPCICI